LASSCASVTIFSALLLASCLISAAFLSASSNFSADKSLDCFFPKKNPIAAPIISATMPIIINSSAILRLLNDKLFLMEN
jgi:hypothetical protein